MTQPHVLFILDKWGMGREEDGVSEWETNIWKSLEALGLTQISTFHFDEYYQLHKELGDAALLAKCTDEKPDFICLVLYKVPGSYHTVPTYETLHTINHIMKIPIVAIWGDLQSSVLRYVADTLTPYTNVNMFTALSTGVNNIAHPETFFYSWVPKDPRIFCDLGLNRDIPISYIGSPKLPRVAAIKFLIDHGIDIYYTGGERDTHISTEEYGQLLNRSQISLSFSRSGDPADNPPIHVINARTFEIMLCGAMLLEQYGIETAKLYEPFIDYVPYSTHEDMLEKVKYYLAHDNERMKVAKAGCQKTMTRYSSLRFWRMVCDKVDDVLVQIKKEV